MGMNNLRLPTGSEFMNSSTSTKISSQIVDQIPSCIVGIPFKNKLVSYKRILNRRQSGMIENDKIIQALKVYKSEEKKTFGFLHCYNTLHLHPKWIERLSQKK